MKRKRILLSSCSVIVACMAVVIGMTWSLFTDSLSVKNHLQSGDLAISLKRTGLEYCVLDGDGKLAVTKVTGEVDFTNPSTNNIFGLDSESMLIVPQSYFEAQMSLVNGKDGKMSTVAFDYDIIIKLTTEANDLAKQLKITVTGIEEEPFVVILDQKDKEVKIGGGTMTNKMMAKDFTVRVEFLDDKTTSGINNNLAQAQMAEFDLIVTATQTTAPTAKN